MRCWRLGQLSWHERRCISCPCASASLRPENNHNTFYGKEASTFRQARNFDASFICLYAINYQQFMFGLGRPVMNNATIIMQQCNRVPLIAVSCNAKNTIYNATMQFIMQHCNNATYNAIMQLCSRDSAPDDGVGWQLGLRYVPVVSQREKVSCVLCIFVLLIFYQSIPIPIKFCRGSF